MGWVQQARFLFHLGLQNRLKNASAVRGMRQYFRKAARVEFSRIEKGRKSRLASVMLRFFRSRCKKCYEVFLPNAKERQSRPSQEFFREPAPAFPLDGSAPRVDSFLPPAQ